MCTHTHTHLHGLDLREQHSKIRVNEIPASRFLTSPPPSLSLFVTETAFPASRSLGEEPSLSVVAVQPHPAAQRSIHITVFVSIPGIPIDDKSEKCGSHGREEVTRYRCAKELVGKLHRYNNDLPSMPRRKKMKENNSPTSSEPCLTVKGKNPLSQRKAAQPSCAAAELACRKATRARGRFLFRLSLARPVFFSFSFVFFWYLVKELRWTIERAVRRLL